MPLRTYEVNVKGQKWQQEITHASAGAAKYAYLRDLREAYPDMKFTDLTCRSLGVVKQNEDFNRVAKYRDVPYAELGMRVMVGDDYGVLIGSNSASNFEVLFETGPYAGKALSCHPNFKIKYYDSADKLIAEF